MASTLKEKKDSLLRLVSDEEPAVVPENARPTDDTPTVISKTNPIVEPGSSSQNKIVDLSRNASSPESIVAGLRGRRLAHYELIEPIGVGGMAAVIRSRDTELDRMVALKILPPEMANEPENVQRFHQEAKAAAKLDHENIARVFYCGEDQGLHFIAFEFVEGINLRVLLDQRGRLPIAEAIRYTLQIAIGLEHATSRGVVHRDVKPSNIIITPTGQAKLVDMGLARNMDRRGENDLTQSGMTLGTFDYISPEQALEPREADARSDIYSLGCTLYHMLTGQAPVPEGTPAKKLHHHQNSAPIDPRQFDPTIPDELVVILGKMMEKKPKDRYQSPIQVVHDLLRQGQKMGISEGLPEVVLVSDPAFANEPRSRPILIVGMALAALAAFTLLLSFASDPTPKYTVPPAPQGNGKHGNQTIVDSAKAKATKGEQPAPRKPNVTTRAEFENVLNDSDSPIVKATMDSIDLISSGLEFHGKTDQILIVESADPKDYRTLTFRYKSTDSAFGLDLKGGKEIIFKRINFEIDYDGTPDQIVAMVAISGAKKVVFSQCTFKHLKQRSVSPDRVPMASVYIDDPADAEQKPIVIVENSVFYEGQVGVAINGAAAVSMTNTAFKPHAAFFHFRNRCSADLTFVNLKHCAAFVTQGPAFRFDEAASAVVRVQNSWFSRPEGTLVTSETAPQPGLIFLAGEVAIKFEGTENLYDALNALVETKTKTTPQLIRSRDEFQKYLKGIGGFDVRSTFDPPVRPLQHPSPLTAPDFRGFQLKAEYKVGLEKYLGASMPIATKSLPSDPTTPAMKFVDKEDKTGDPGVFATLHAALAGAKDGDVIHVKCGEDRLVAVRPAELDSGVSVTIKPAAGYQPILVLSKTVRDKDNFFFKVQDGRIRVEQMEIVLDPPKDAGFVTQSVVHLGETAQCQFKNCVFTLRATNDVQLNVVTFLDPSQMAKMEMPNPVPAAKVEFHECFIRGKGDVVALRGCRLLHVEMKNSLVALAGSLLDVEAGSKDVLMSQGVRWKMERSSIYTSDPVFFLKSPVAKGLTETQAEVEGCLLASLTSEQLIVQLEIGKDSENVDKRFLKWAGKDNFYANFADRQVNAWKELYPETGGSKYGALTFPTPALSDETKKQPLWEAMPDWFAPEKTELESIKGFGLPADLQKRLLGPITPPPSDDP